MKEGNKKQLTAKDTYLSFADEVNRYDSLSAHEEQDLWVRVENGDNKAFDTIIKFCLKYVVGFSSKYAGCEGIYVEDLIGEGNLALIEASQEYDRSRGDRFYTFAQYKVKGAIINMVKNSSKLKASRNNDIESLEAKDEKVFADDGVSWCDNLPNRIQNYLDRRYYPGAGRLFINTMLLTTEGYSLIEAAAKQDVAPDFIKRMKREVKSHFKNRKRLATCPLPASLGPNGDRVLQDGLGFKKMKLIEF